jgi:hypothetical protein
VTPANLEPQHLQALRSANEIRLYRAALRREVHGEKGEGAHEAGRVKLAAILDFPAAERRSIASLPVVDFLCWARHLTHPHAARYASACGLSEWSTVGQMTDRQRVKLAGLLQDGIGAVKRAELENEITQWVAERNRRAAA